MSGATRIRLLAYTDSDTIGGAGFALGYLLGALAREIEVGVLATSAEVGEALAAHRPGVRFTVVRPPVGAGDRRALLAHMRAIRSHSPTSCTPTRRGRGHVATARSLHCYAQGCGLWRWITCRSRAPCRAGGSRHGDCWRGGCTRMSRLGSARRARSRAFSACVRARWARCPMGCHLDGMSRRSRRLRTDCPSRSRRLR